MKKTSVMLASALVLVATARIGWTQSGGPTFEQLDKDGNGSLSKEEVSAYFAQLPRRGGGAQQGGQANGRGFNVDRVFSRWDANGDGKVTKEEFDNRPRRQRQGGQGGQGGND
jgi:hypothetical protein